MEEQQMLLAVWFSNSCIGRFLLRQQSKCPGNDAVSLCYSFTVNISESGLSHKVQGQLDEETFILCNRKNCHAIGGLGETLKAKQSWETQVNTLKDGIEQVIGRALYMKPKNDTIRANGNPNASCALYRNGHKVLYLHPSTRKWTEVDPGSMQIKEKWEQNKNLRDFLNKTSQGDCRDYLEKTISKLDLEKKLEPTVLVKDTAGIFTSTLPTIAPDVDQSSSMTTKPNAFVLLFTLALLVLLNYLLKMLQRSRESSSGSTTLPFHQPPPDESGCCGHNTSCSITLC
ncbi:UL16-binding protein 1-like [Microtus ochrogaster]|uniref:UL16-binding protein 1-like n=1 Tax=Microtus ochrogaster TaxID=79684 RepID=A0ABM1AYZ8_MICOH|nr:UL16-binding protein 1-like [Microtus ochrogaster]